MSQQASASLLQLPALAPPPGVIPNFTNPENRGPTLVIVGAILLGLVVIAMANRAYTKLRIIRKASWDDLTVALAGASAIVWYSLCVLIVQKGIIGRHQYELRVGDILKNNIIIPSYVILVLNGPTLWVTKLTFFLLYLQIFRPMRWLRICIYLGITLSTIFYWSLSIALFVSASPRSGETWIESYVLSRIELQSKLNIAIAAGGMLIDVWLFVLPLAAIYNLHLQDTRKVGLTIIFSTGLIAVAASAASVYCRYKIQHDTDGTWNGLNVELLYLVELDVGIITACMPSFARMLRHHLPPWATVKSRLEFKISSSPNEGSKGYLVTKRSKPTNFDEVDDNREERLYINSTSSSAGVELENMAGVENFTGYATADAYDEDRTYLKQHDSQQA